MWNWIVPTTGTNPKNTSYKNCYLYFLRCGDAVKVGRSFYPRARLSSFRHDIPGKMEFIAIMPNYGVLERACHEYLRDWRIAGEWFFDCYKVYELIEQLERQRQEVKPKKKVISTAGIGAGLLYM